MLAENSAHFAGQRDAGRDRSGVDRPRERARDGRRQLVREDHALGRLDRQRGLPRGGSFAPRPPEERSQRDQLANSEADLQAVGHHGLMILRDERLDDAGPDQHAGRARRRSRTGRGRSARKRSARVAAPAPADQCPRQYEAGLPAEQDRRNLDDAVRQQPACEERRLTAQRCSRRSPRPESRRCRKAG